MNFFSKGGGCLDGLIVKKTESALSHPRIF